MATTPNGNLVKLAVGIASAAALAGLAGQFGTGEAPRQAADLGAAPEAAGEWWDEDEDDEHGWWDEEDDHDDDHGEDDDEDEEEPFRFLARPGGRERGGLERGAVPRTRTSRS